MNLRDQLIRIADLYCAAAGLSEARVSTMLFSGGQRFKQIRDGGDLGTRKFEVVMQWFSDHWPAGLDWPAEVPRPAPQKIPEAAE